MKTAILVIVGLLASVSTFAASSGDLTISGTVALINDIVIYPKAAATQLDILNGELAGKSVADVSETSNSSTGYKISMRSANASKLINTSLSSANTSYTISYDGGSYVSLTTVDQVVKTSSTNSLVTDSSDVSVKVSAFGTAPAGTYQDVVTISISSI